MPKPSPYPQLLKTLCSLPATDEGGFEGFLRDAVAAIIRRHLNLVKSEPQGGINNGTPPEDGQAAIGVEAKRYGAINPSR